MQSRIRRAIAIAVLVGAWIFLAISSLQGAIPLTYDEAWNYLHLSTNGPRHVVTNYPVPNNQVFFTFLQSFVPDALVLRRPLTLRLINLAVVLALASLVTWLLKANSAFDEIASAILSLCILFATPVLAIYLFVARGYLLGCLCLLLACVFVVKPRGIYPMSLFLALAAWSVPTYLYCFPGLLVSYVIVDRSSPQVVRKSTLKIALSTIVLVLILYSGTLQEMLRFRSGHWSGFPDLQSFFLGVASNFTSFRGSPIAVPIVTAFIFFATLGLAVRAAWKREMTRSAQLAVALLMTVVSFFVCMIFLFLTGLALLPYERNVVFIAIFIPVAALLLLSPFSRWIRWSFGGLLLLNAGFGVFLVTNAFLVQKNPLSYPRFSDFSPTPLEKVKVQQLKGIDAIVYEQNSAPVAQLYARSMGVPSALAVIHAKQCGMGRILPPSSLRIGFVMRQKAVVVCF